MRLQGPSGELLDPTASESGAAPDPLVCLRLNRLKASRTPHNTGLFAITKIDEVFAFVPIVSRSSGKDS
jgi:hypothetical protein